LLISAYAYLLDMLPKGSLPPKLVFLGDGPARSELEGICNDKGYDAVFMGQKVGKDVADCFASADVFGFPSFTEVSQDDANLG
jgi:glycosyltransferase involved in cell wall biosynthesis